MNQYTYTVDYTVDARFIHYLQPPEYDRWGLNPAGECWNFSFCVMDDFGTAVPIDPFVHQYENCRVCIAPDYANPPAEGEPYKYIRHYPNGH